MPLDAKPPRSVRSGILFAAAVLAAAVFGPGPAAAATGPASAWAETQQTAVRLIAATTAVGQRSVAAPGARVPARSGLEDLLALAGRRRLPAAARLVGLREREIRDPALAGAGALLGAGPGDARLQGRGRAAAGRRPGGARRTGAAAGQGRLPDLRRHLHPLHRRAVPRPAGRRPPRPALRPPDRPLRRPRSRRRIGARPDHRIGPISRKPPTIFGETCRSSPVGGAPSRRPTCSSRGRSTWSSASPGFRVLGRRRRRRRHASASAG